MTNEIKGYISVIAGLISTTIGTVIGFAIEEFELYTNWTAIVVLFLVFWAIITIIIRTLYFGKNLMTKPTLEQIRQQCGIDPHPTEVKEVSYWYNIIRKSARIDYTQLNVLQIVEMLRKAKNNV